MILDYNILKTAMKIKIFILIIITTSVLQGQSINETNLDNNAKKALNAFRQKNHILAVELYEKTIKYSPILKMEYFINLSKSYIVLEQYKEAISTTRHGIRFNQVMSWDIYYQQGYAFYKLKEYNKAITPIKNAIELSQENSYLYNFLGLMYLYSKDYKNAEQNFVIATTYSPQNPVYLCNLASSYEIQTNLKNALITYEKAIYFDLENKTLAKTESTRIRNYLISKNQLPIELNTTNNISNTTTNTFQNNGNYSNSQTNNNIVSNRLGISNY